MPVHPKPGPIRRINMPNDLPAVADLIESCFPIHLDHDGKTYVDQMRKAARDMRVLKWLPNFHDLTSGRAAGFVWEEDGRIIGNLSLIPFQEGGRRVHLIANVAVDPSHRRRGIGRSLTQRALDYLRQLREPRVWLQVRDDNPPALNLYRSLGFVDIAARSTWRVKPKDLSPADREIRSCIAIRRRKAGDWDDQKAWLETAYPSDLRWNLPVNFKHLSSDIVQQVANFMDGETYKHWAVEQGGELRGVITWQKTNSYAHNLWLAFPVDREGEILPEALSKACRRLGRWHPLAVDYPKGRFEEGFEALGFVHFRTLVWMRCELD